MMRALILLFILLLQGCWMDSAPNSGIMITGNTVTAEGDTVQVRYGQGAKDINNLARQLQSSQNTDLLTMDNLVMRWTKQDWEGWDFIVFSPNGQASNHIGLDSAFYLGVPIWASLGNGSVLLNSQTLLQIPHPPYAQQDQIELGFEFNPVSLAKGNVLASWIDTLNSNSIRLVGSNNNQINLIFAHQNLQTSLTIPIDIQKWNYVKICVGSSRIQIFVNDTIKADTSPISNWQSPKATLNIGGQVQYSSSLEGPFTGLLNFVYLKAVPEIQPCWGYLQNNQHLYDCPTLSSTDQFFTSRLNLYQWSRLTLAIHAIQFVNALQNQAQNILGSNSTDTIVYDNAANLTAIGPSYFYTMCQLPDSLYPAAQQVISSDSTLNFLYLLNANSSTISSELDIKTSTFHSRQQKCALPSGDSLELNAFEPSGIPPIYQLIYHLASKKLVLTLTNPEFISFQTPTN